MAGSYPDVPAPRMAYDRDGTVGTGWLNGNLPVELTTNELERLNDVNDSTTIDAFGKWGSSGPYFVALIFPQLRDISGILVAIRGGPDQGSISPLEYSTDTTNGLDGTWTSGLDPTAVRFMIPSYRTGIETWSETGVKAIRLRWSRGGETNRHLQGLHVYGSIASGETEDRLRIWHPTLDEPLDDNNSSDGAYFDWGDVERASSADKTFRIKNNSSSLTANSIAITQEILTDASPSIPPQFTFSDGGAFATSINIGNLAPGAISSVVTKRYAVDSSAALSVWSSRTVVDAGSWT